MTSPPYARADGVDRSQIRRLRALLPRERIRHMVQVAQAQQRFRDLARRVVSSSSDPQRLLATLNQHGVRYIEGGDVAAIVFGSPLPAESVAITPARDRPNLDRLGAALRELNARIRTEGEPNGVAFPCDGGFLGAQPLMLNLVTDVGDVDLTLAPAGFPDGYDQLVTDSVEIDIGDGAVTRIASLDDVITSKRAAGRNKDIAALPYLEALAEEIAREG